MLTDASETGLSDKSVDVAFLFSVVHALGDVDTVMWEMHHVLKTKGALSIQRSWWSEKETVGRCDQEWLVFLQRENQ